MENQPNPFDDIQYTLQEIVEVVGHPTGEAEQIAQALLTRVMQFSLAYIVAQKPEYKETLKRLGEETNTTEFMKILLENVSLKQVSEAIQTAMTDVMSYYFQEIAASLSPDQKTAITNIVTKFHEETRK